MMGAREFAFHGLESVSSCLFTLPFYRFNTRYAGWIIFMSVDDSGPEVGKCLVCENLFLLQRMFRLVLKTNSFIHGYYLTRK